MKSLQQLLVHMVCATFQWKLSSNFRDKTCGGQPRPNNTRTNQPTPWSRVFLEKLIIPQLIKKLHCLLRNPYFHCCIHERTPPVPILSHMNPVYNFPLCLTKIHSNIILPSTPRSSELSLPFKLSNHNFVSFSISPIHAARPSHLIVQSTCKICKMCLLLFVSWSSNIC
jgi:hypothetical protein